MSFHLGVIEGFYGKPWSEEERKSVIRLLAPHDYSLYIYAPKGDPFLRKRWREKMPEETRSMLRGLSESCEESGVTFGVGLSPYELFRSFDEEGKASLLEKIEFFDEIGVNHLGILFDDMKGDLPGLARLQVEILHWIRDRSKAKKISLCPTYYCFDPVLDRVFGKRPDRYLEELGEDLDPSIDLFWTGEEVCSREVTPGHLRAVGELLGRKPLLWDNYPVNDGQRMCKYLHLRGFTGRPASSRGYLAGHIVNPMNQALLSSIPALTLSMSYDQGESYSYGSAFLDAARKVVGDGMAHQLQKDILFFQDVGLDGLSDEQKQRFRDTYSAFDHPAAQEVRRWLDGEFNVTRELVLTQ